MPHQLLALVPCLLALAPQRPCTCARADGADARPRAAFDDGHDCHDHDHVPSDPRGGPERGHDHDPDCPALDIVGGWVAARTLDAASVAVDAAVGLPTASPSLGEPDTAEQPAPDGVDHAPHVPLFLSHCALRN